MTDRDLLLKRLAFIDTCVVELKTLARPDLLATDVRERRFVEHTLQLAIQSALDAASHIISERSLGEPLTNREVFERLVGDGWLAAEQVPALRDMAGFRNVLVHGYTAVDLGIVRRVLEQHLDDLTRFTASVRARVGP